MKVEKDYEGLLRLFNKHKVKYCIVGAFAVAFYAKPRYTKDIDILVEPSAGNSKKIINALNEFGFKSLGLKPADFIEKGKIIQLGYEPVRIDLITSIQGCSFEEVWKEKKKGIYGKEKVEERHRHRYEVNPKYIKALTEKGFVFSGKSPDNRLMEICEIPGHPFFIGTQFHPEFTSRPLAPNPIFFHFIEASLKKES